MHIKFLVFAAALSLGVVSTDGRASGTHAGGHGDGDESIGIPGNEAKVTRTIAVNMTDDMRFTPARITVKRGETVRFKVTNSGRIKHEFVLGTTRSLEEHYKAMLKFPEMEHADENMVTVAPAKTGEIVWQFTRPGKVAFACLHPGHYEAGMKGQVVVLTKQSQSKK